MRYPCLIIGILAALLFLLLLVTCRVVGLPISAAAPLNPVDHDSSRQFACAAGSREATGRLWETRSLRGEAFPYSDRAFRSGLFLNGVAKV